MIKVFTPCRRFKLQLQIPHRFLIHLKEICVPADSELRAGPEFQAGDLVLKQDLGVAEHLE